MSAMTSQLRLLFSQRHGEVDNRPYDAGLLLIALALLSIGLVIVTSASMPVATRLTGNPFYFALRHITYIGLALVAAAVVLQVPMQMWKKWNFYLLAAAIVLLIVVLGIGRNVNGSTRWIVIGPITIQVAEIAKLCFFLYLSGYLVRRYQQITKTRGLGFWIPLFVFGVMAFFLLMQPDLGTVIVMFATTVGLLFLAGAPLLHFIALLLSGVSVIGLAIALEPYRMRRVTAFMDPWADPFGSGYQLTQSLMAYGRGDWFGQGLGNSLQKLEYLPEAHTDFIMAILAEELGYAGVLAVLILMLILVVKCLRLGNRALAQERAFEGFFAYAVSIWFSLQTAVNIGASAGILPTKGLTLPLVSYGGSSLILMAVTVAIIVRIDFELRMQNLQALPVRKRRLTDAKTQEGNNG